MIIDSHAHMGLVLLNDDPKRKLPVTAVTIEDTIAVMDESEIDMAIIFAPLWQDGPFNDPDYYLSNYLIYEACQKYPDRFIGYGRVSPNRGTYAVRELKVCLEQYKLRGLMLHPDWESFSPANRRVMWPLAEICAEHKIPLTFHTGYYPKCQPMLFVPLAEAFPTVPIYMKHIGYEYWRDAALLAKRYPNIYLETAANTTCSEILASIRIAGVDKVCYGSDFPYIDPRVVIKKINCLPLTEEERAKIFWKNTAAINRLDLPQTKKAA